MSAPKAPDPRLYVIVRGDLPSGLMLAQTGHVTRKFTRRFPEIPVLEDENLVVLAERDEPALLRRRELLEWEVPLASIAEFHEPDLDGALTAIAVHGGVTPETARLLRKLVSDLPPALRENVPPRHTFGVIGAALPMALSSSPSNVPLGVPPL